MVSLVVPAISLTIALLSFKSVLSKVDFPALGLPTIATLTPFFTTLPSLKEWSNFFVDADILPINSINFFLSANATSSSLKSSSNSIRDEN